ncbi:MAG: cytidylate kinase-like family protein [Parasporobacterium sp.]|nr:cytidylate kinase-like family protein [Parasporobacterium sp.]
MNIVITVGREFGSGGRELARKLAEYKGFAYYDNEVLTEIVKQTELSEKYVNEVLEGANSRVYSAGSENTLSYGMDYSLTQLQEIYGAQTEVIKALALKSDCVIVGRCADYILKDVEGIQLFRVFIHADLDARVKRCIDRAHEGEDTNEKIMRKKVQKVDRNRARYYEDYTLQEWGDKSNYDICFNTTNMDIDAMIPHIAKLFE